MNRAEQMALEKYPAHSIRIVPARSGGYYADKHLRDGFIEGYHQAEKDLLANKHEKSWRLDEKLWKGIKDIEEASYQYTYDASNDWAYDIPTWEDVQDAFKAGSEWKEDLALTWEDVMLIHRCIKDAMNYHLYKMMEGVEGQKVVYQEVLKRFKAMKEK